MGWRCRNISQKFAAKDYKLLICQLLAILILFSVTFFIGSSSLIVAVHKEKLLGEGLVQDTRLNGCEDNCIHDGSESLPKGIVAHTSNLEMQSLSSSQSQERPKRPSNLLAIAAGAKQAENVNKIVEKFPASEFALMLFHYDGMVGKWKKFEWNSRAIHVSAINQTKWWFAKRFLHPDIVSDYSYIFLWDEDLGVDHFCPERYLSIIQKEKLEISQPALDPLHSIVHHPHTVKERNSTVHRVFSAKLVDNKKIASVGSKVCGPNNINPPCAGFIEMMAPVFSKASWRCVWHMIQNDLITGWGLDIRFGYCAQGNRVQNVGVVDAEYVTHKGISTLVSSKAQRKFMNLGVSQAEVFERRWKKASDQDSCWVDPYRKQTYTRLYAP